MTKRKTTLPVRTGSIRYRSLISVGIILSLLILLWQCQPEIVEEKNGGLFLPDGFEALLVVDSLKGKARHIAVNENGDIYVKYKRADGPFGNAALRDTDGDGRADIIQSFGEYNHDGPLSAGMTIWNGYLYYSSQRGVYRQKLKPGQLVPDSPIDTILKDTLGQGMREHIAKPITFDPQGRMYIPFGAPSNACQEPKRTPGAPGLDPCPQLEKYAGVWRFDPNKTGQTQEDGYHYATGIRSLVCMDWNKDDNSLYAVMHGRDDLFRMFSGVYSPWQSALLPSEEFIKITEHSNFGWPYCYYDQLQEKKVLAPEYGGDGEIVDRCSDYDLPLIGFPGHWAPNGLLFYQGDQFPERYKGGAFIAFHGSTNRAPYPQSGYIIAFVPFKDGAPAGDWEIFADGFAKVDPIVNVSDAVYRPMGIAMGPDGSLYISETEEGKIWRIQYTGDKAQFGPEQLAGMEERKQLSHIRTPDKVEDNLQKDLVSGSQVYYLYCSSCHQRNGRGAEGRFPPLINNDWVSGDKNRLISLVINGLQGPIEVNGEAYNSVMPKHDFLSDEEVAEVLTYIRQNFENQASAVTAAEVKAIRAKGEEDVGE